MLAVIIGGEGGGGMRAVWGSLLVRYFLEGLWTLLLIMVCFIMLHNPNYLYHDYLYY